MAAPVPAVEDLSGVPPNVRLVFAALVLVVLLASLDQTIVSTALPTIVRQLGGLEQLTWVVTSYLLATTVAGPLYAKLGDMYGRKLILQIAIAVFLVGSALCGQARSMEQLIAFRVLQGLGGGGLIVTSTAVVGDLVPPRQRGRYQGIFGAVFGVSTIIGPLVGGFFVQHLTWRWIFYVNLPVGLLALAVIAVVFRSAPARRRHRIDYVGAVLLTTALSSLVLVTSLPGVLLPWGSWTAALLAGVWLLATAAFVLVERRATEPILPLDLFRNRVFVVAGWIGFVVGVAMFSAVTYLPLYLQVVRRISPATSGLQLGPMMGGMLMTSVLSGQLITRFGRYKPFPIAGTALATGGLFLLSRLDAHTPMSIVSLQMLMLGLGLGMVMQILVLAVQNAVSYENLGVATSGATLFRLIGGVVGLSVFGALFAHRLHAGQEFVAAMRPVFQVAAALGALAFVASLFLPALPLRQTVAASRMSETFALPRGGESLEELERLVCELARQENHWGVYERLAARAGLALAPPETWLLARLRERAPIRPGALGQELHLEPDAVTQVITSLESRQLVSVRDDCITLTQPGQYTLDRLIAARRQALADLLQGWAPEKHAEVRQLLDRLAAALMSEIPVRPTPAG